MNINNKLDQATKLILLLILVFSKLVKKMSTLTMLAVLIFYGLKNIDAVDIDNTNV